MMSLYKDINGRLSLFKLPNSLSVQRGYSGDKGTLGGNVSLCAGSVTFPTNATKHKVRIYKTCTIQKDDGASIWTNYISFTIEEAFENKEFRACVREWLEKVTPDFTITKNGGMIRFENNKTKESLICDLQNKKFIRSYKKGKDRVIKYPTQFFKYMLGEIIIKQIGEVEGNDMDTFKRFLELVAKNNWSCRNLGTFLVRMFDHFHLETYLSAGVNFTYNNPFGYNDFDKDIRNKLNAHNVTYSQEIGSIFCSDKDTGRAIFAQIKNSNNFPKMLSLLSDNIQPLNTLVNHHGYTIKDLFVYANERLWDVTRSGTLLPDPNEPSTSVDSWYYAPHRYRLVSFLRDYARMADIVYDGNYQKYPKNLLEAHDEVTKLFESRQYSTEEKANFEETIDSRLEWKGKGFQIIYPKSADEVLAEGRTLRHCVGSYVRSVISGECRILFLRSKENLTTPLVTVEIRKGRISQARGYGNSTPNYDCQIALNEYAKDKKLIYG